MVGEEGGVRRWGVVVVRDVEEGGVWGGGGMEQIGGISIGYGLFGWNSFSVWYW